MSRATDTSFPTAGMLQDDWGARFEVACVGTELLLPSSGGSIHTLHVSPWLTLGGYDPYGATDVRPLLGMWMRPEAEEKHVGLFTGIRLGLSFSPGLCTEVSVGYQWLTLHDVSGDANGRTKALYFGVAIQ